MAGMLAPSQKGYRSGGVSVGVFQLADCVVGALQSATKLPSSQRETRDAGPTAARGAAWAWVRAARAALAGGTDVMPDSWGESTY